MQKEEEYDLLLDDQIDFIQAVQIPGTSEEASIFCSSFNSDAALFLGAEVAFFTGGGSDSGSEKEDVHSGDEKEPSRSSLQRAFH